MKKGINIDDLLLEIIYSNEQNEIKKGLKVLDCLFDLTKNDFNFFNNDENFTKLEFIFKSISLPRLLIYEPEKSNINSKWYNKLKDKQNFTIQFLNFLVFLNDENLSKLCHTYFKTDSFLFETICVSRKVSLEIFKNDLDNYSLLSIYFENKKNDSQLEELLLTKLEYIISKGIDEKSIYKISVKLGYNYKYYLTDRLVKLIKNKQKIDKHFIDKLFFDNYMFYKFNGVFNFLGYPKDEDIENDKNLDYLLDNQSIINRGKISFKKIPKDVYTLYENNEELKNYLENKIIIFSRLIKNNYKVKSNRNQNYTPYWDNIISNIDSTTFNYLYYKPELITITEMGIIKKKYKSFKKVSDYTSSDYYVNYFDITSILHTLLNNMESFKEIVEKYNLLDTNKVDKLINLMCLNLLADTEYNILGTHIEKYTHKFSDYLSNSSNNTDINELIKYLIKNIYIKFWFTSSVYTLPQCILDDLELLALLERKLISHSKVINKKIYNPNTDFIFTDSQLKAMNFKKIVDYF